MDQQEQLSISEKCSPAYGNYKYKQELSQKGVGEKTEASFKFMCDVWGYQSFFFAVILVALVFHKHAFDFLKRRGVKIGEDSEKK
ncbi:MAG: hypothetical protein HC880_00465 [Bacteroidia bacterium]|nr:hypothetical protein [Bacteroidia bacterium]